MLRFALILVSLFFILQPICSLFAQDNKESASVAQKPASEEKPISPGIKRFGNNFMIFPTEQPSNSFYIGKTKYFSKKGFILRDVIEAPEGYVYSGETENQKKTMGYFGKLEAEFTELEGGFFQLKKDSLSKLYRNYPGDKIQELLPRSNTAAGLVYNGHDRAVFFHIANGKSIETEDGKMKYLYTFKIHLTDIKTPNIKTISPQIDDFDPILKLNWLKRNVVQYILSDGQKFQINVD